MSLLAVIALSVFVRDVTVSGSPGLCLVHWVPYIETSIGDRVAETVKSGGAVVFRHVWFDDGSGHQRTPWPVTGPGPYRYTVTVQSQTVAVWRVTVVNLCTLLFMDGFESGDTSAWTAKVAM